MSKKQEASLQEELQEIISQNYILDDVPPVTERIRNIGDVFAEIGMRAEDVVPWRNPTSKKQISQNANALIAAITEVYNEGDVPDWNNANQAKYCLWFSRARGSGWVLRFVVGCRDCAYLGAGHYFKSEMLARDAYSKFKYVWDEYLPE